MYAGSYVLGRNFVLGEFPCWQHATTAEVGRLQLMVDNVLQPVRDRWGRTDPTSWTKWRSGCLPRSGAHRFGGTVDFVVPGANLRTVFDWGVHHLLPLGYLGRWIYEPETEHQGEHIHAASRQDMIDAFGKSDIGAYIETGPGEYSPVGPDGPTHPIPIPGIDVVVSRPLPWWAWILAGALAAETARRAARDR